MPAAVSYAVQRGEKMAKEWKNRDDRDLLT